MYQTEETQTGKCGGRERGPRGWFGRHGAPDFAAWAEQIVRERRHGFGGERGERGHRWERGFGGGFGPGFGRGGGRERMFDAGDLKLVLLKLLAEQPSYGYQLIKTMEERLAGGYAPSPGVIYPTLTLLEEEGLASVTTSDANKKVYSVTVEGEAFLAANKERVDAIFARLTAQGEHFQRGRSPELMKAFLDLRGAVMAKVARGTLTPEQAAKIAEAIHGAAKAIDAM